RLLLLRPLRLPREPGHILWTQPSRGPQEVGHFPWTLADDICQVGRNTPCECEQLVRIATDDLRYLPHPVFSRRVELGSLDLGQIGRAYADFFRHLTQANLLRLTLLPH